MPDGILDDLVAVVVEIDDVIVFANDLALELLEWADRTEPLIGTSFDALICEDLRFAQRTIRRADGSEIQVAEQLIPTTWKGTPALAHVLHPPGPPEHAQQPHAPKPPLTRREAQVASQLAEGFTVANIAARLEISESTVRTHVKSIYRKAGTRSRVDLAWMVPNLNKRSR